MLSHALFGIASSVFVLVGGIPYLIDIHKERVHPHVLSWLGWAFLTALGASAMMADGATWAATILWANTILTVSISVYALIRNVSVWATGFYDVVFFTLGIIGLVLWQVLDMPVIALVSAILADLFFGLPTIIKTYKDPSTETPFVWVMSTISGILAIFAVKAITFNELAYPFYLLLYDGIVLLLVLKIIKRSNPKI